jgi:hypothetical protein
MGGERWLEVCPSTELEVHNAAVIQAGWLSCACCLPCLQAEAGVGSSSSQSCHCSGGSNGAWTTLICPSWRR